jgi:hypothetical protein
MFVKAAQWVLLAAFVYPAGAVAVRASRGAGLPKATIHLESASASAFIAGLCLRARKARSAKVAAAGLPLLTIVPFLITLKAPFLFDSNAHLVNASQQSFQRALRFFYGHPALSDFFFRPLGYMDYWLEYRWAGFSPVLWHAGSIALHVFAVYLLFALCRTLGASPWASCAGALFFGFHGSNAETVSWIAARFDLWAVCFTLITLLLLCRSAREGKLSVWLLISCACALLSKESAFCLPALALSCLSYRGRLDRRGWKAVAAITAVCVFVFAYRAWVVGGIGGYRNSAGAPMILHFGLVRIPEVIFFRLWSVLLFPVNFSASSEVWLTTAWLLLLIAGVMTMLFSRPLLRRVLASLLFAVSAIVPVIPFAALDTRLTGSRVYHLSLIGLALLIAALFDGLADKKLAATVIAGFLVFQCTALIHNLLIWRGTALLAGHTCSSFARMTNATQRAFVFDLPATHNGVFFLSNGFPDCVYVNTGKHITISESGVPGPGDTVFVWDPKSDALVKIR